MRQLIIAALISAAMAAPVAAQITVSNGPPTTDLAPFGKDAGAPPGGVITAVAQTYTPLGGFNYLQTFQFFIGGGFGLNGDLLNLTAAVYAFDTDHVVGGPLFSPISLFGNAAATDQAVTIGNDVHPLNWFLASGGTYAIVLSALDGFAATPDGSTIEFGATDDVYPGGALFFATTTDPSGLGDPGAFTDAGGVFGSGVGSLDAAGSATFTTDRVTGTPEPSTVVMLASGLIPLGVAVRRRRRAA